MHYEIRGLIEENIEWLLETPARTIGMEPTYWNLPDEVKRQVAFDAAFNRLIGFHAMWMMIEGNEREDDHAEVIGQIVKDNMDRLMYAIDEHETEAKQSIEQDASVPSYDIEKE